MTKEEVLRSFLEDDLFIEKGYLKKDEIEEFKWSAHTDNKLIGVIKFAIDGEVAGDITGVTEKKINRYLKS